MKLSRIKEYLKAIENGFDWYGLNGFYEMHEDVCNGKSEKWDSKLESLNDLDFDEFELLCSVYLKSVK